jgi:AraC family ethanolamine operon transcriptional activator
LGYLMQSQIFRDFDAFAGAVRDANCAMLLENLVHPRWGITHLELAGVHVQVGQEGSGNITEGQARADGYVIFLPLDNSDSYAANGIALDKHSFAILEPGCDFCVRSKAEHVWCSIFVPTPQFACDGDRELSSGCDKSVCRVTRPNPQLGNRFRALVYQIITTAANCHQIESSLAATRAAAELRKVAALVIGKRQAGEPNPEGRPRLSRWEIIRRSKVLLEERVDKLVRLEELAVAAEVSERTLRTAFNEYFGVGPVRYLQLRQLHQIHRALRAADPEAVSVSKVLVAHGVWEFSRFASRYHRLFGELPSVTLRKQGR